VTPSWRIIVGDAAQTVSTLPAASVQCCVTSPPYYSLRDYGVDGQIGLEDTPDEYVQRLVDVFREVRRVLRDDGTVWLNLGDSYAANRSYQVPQSKHQAHDFGSSNAQKVPSGLKAKDLIGVPWLVAFALRADGWYLRQEIIWAKTAPMPESVRDRCARAHEQVFMLSKRPTYFYDQEAIKQPSSDPGRENGRDGRDEDERARPPGSRPRTLARRDYREHGANRRSVWTLGPEPYADAHFAVMPGRLAQDCLLAGSSEMCCGTCGAPWERVVERTSMVVREGPGRAGLKDAATGATSRTATTGTMLEPPTSRTVGWRASCEHDDPSGSSVVLDPFSGAGTTGVQALRAGRSYVGVELNAGYAELARSTGFAMTRRS
jgi:DNA modification methylase